MIEYARRNAVGSIVAKIDDHVMCVPDDMGNRHRILLADWEAQGNTITPYAEDAPTADDVDAERDRRITAGFFFAGAFFQARVEDQKRIAGAGTLALGAIVGGAQPGDLRWHGDDGDFVWIAADNTAVPMDAQTVFAFGQAAAAWEAKHVFAARALKDTNPIPADYADDRYWA